ncbi:MAG: arsenite methyltransferase [Dehalococcoidia bacterium]|nr:arsenite methyltransferase [Dehalococcoidia bacterium]
MKEKKEEIRKFVRLGYAGVAMGNASCCGPSTAGGCCGISEAVTNASKAVGYTDEDVNSVPEGANLGLGCGNPVAMASIKEGDTVLDLGSGAGFDCFLASKCAGAAGKVIGVDMTPEMLEKARENAHRGGYQNVEFRLGEIENLPVADNYVDIIISNCVINLSPDKARVFSEAYRVLKAGGRLMVSDIVLLEELPDYIQKSVAAYIGCIAGAALKAEYLESINCSGFKDIKVIEETGFGIDYASQDPTFRQIMEDEKVTKADLTRLGKAVRSVKVSAVKPSE